MLSIRQPLRHRTTTPRSLAILGVGLALLLGACADSEPANPWTVHETSAGYTLIDPEDNVIQASDVRLDADEAESGELAASALNEDSVEKRLVKVECEICVQNPDTGSWTCFGCHP